jgi:PAS domain S-box-containing protein
MIMPTYILLAAFLALLTLTLLANWQLFRQRVQLCRQHQELHGRLDKLSPQHIQEPQRHRIIKGRPGSYLQLMDTLINTIPSPIFYKDIEGIFRGCNQAFAQQVLGLTRDRIIGRRLEDLADRIPPDLADLNRRHEDRMLAGASIVTFEAQVPCADGTRRDFLFSIAAVTEKDGHISGSIGVMQDLTEKNRALRNKSQKEKLQGVLETAGAVCHELNQPLQIVSGYLEMAMLKEHANPDLAPLLSMLHTQLDRMKAITGQLQNITRYETKPYSGNTNIIDIRKASRPVNEVSEYRVSCPFE